MRYYDKVGLLSPQQHTESGYRLYTDEDLVSLQQILALKFLGFSLEEIKVYLQTEPQRLHEVLALQKAMMEEKRSQLNSVIAAIERAQGLLENDTCDLDAIANVIRVMHMEQNKEWVNKYLTPAQQQKMAEISGKSYSPEAARKIAQWGQTWTEEDQQRATQQWDTLYSELRRLIAEGKDPADPDAQTMAKFFCDLIGQFTRGDAEVDRGVGQWWQNHEALPEQERPVPQYSQTPEEAAFLQKAVAIYKQKG